jgi:hypothetical protein
LACWFGLRETIDNQIIAPAEAPLNSFGRRRARFISIESSDWSAAVAPPPPPPLDEGSCHTPSKQQKANDKSPICWVRL